MPWIGKVTLMYALPTLPGHLFPRTITPKCQNAQHSCFPPLHSAHVARLCLGAGMYDAMRELDRQQGVSTVLDGAVVKGLTRYSQRFVENFYSNSRLEVRTCHRLALNCCVLNQNHSCFRHLSSASFLFLSRDCLALHVLVPS